MVDGAKLGLSMEASRITGREPTLDLAEWRFAHSADMSKRNAACKPYQCTICYRYYMILKIRLKL